MMSSEGNGRGTCGPHTELAKNDDVRITRCACGTIHLTIVRSGITMQLRADTLMHLSAACKEALSELGVYSPTEGSGAPDRCIH